MRVRDKVSNTRHKRYGRLAIGYIREVRDKDFTPALFEKVPEFYKKRKDKEQAQIEHNLAVRRLQKGVK